MCISRTILYVLFLWLGGAGSVCWKLNNYDMTKPVMLFSMNTLHFIINSWMLLSIQQCSGVTSSDTCLEKKKKCIMGLLLLHYDSTWVAKRVAQLLIWKLQKTMTPRCVGICKWEDIKINATEQVDLEKWFLNFLGPPPPLCSITGP